MRIVPINLRTANDFVEKHHRHSARTAADGGKYAIGLLSDTDILIGVGIVWRPVARLLNDNVTAELLRCCVSPDAPKGATSKIYSRCKRIWQLMGGVKFVTYTLKREGGASMRGAGMTCHQIIESIMRQQSRSGKMPDAFYIHESELAGDDLVKSMGWLEFYNPHHPLHRAVIGRNFPNDKELVEAGLLIAGVPIKVSN